MTKRYSADYLTIEKYEKMEKGRKFSGIGCVLIAGLTLGLYSSPNMTRDLMESFGTSRSEMELYLLIISIASFVWGGVNLAISIVCRKKLEALHNSFVSIDANEIHGTTHRTDLDRGTPFHVTFDKVTSAGANHSDELNLIIRTSIGTFQCLAISNAGRAADLINRRCIEHKAAEQTKTQIAAVAQAATAGPVSLVCPNCNKVLSEGMQFCGLCGSAGVIRPQQTVSTYQGGTPPFVVRPIYEKGTLTCPVCATKGQLPNRNVCLNCGIVFLKD